MTRTQHMFLFDVAGPHLALGVGEPDRLRWNAEHYYVDQRKRGSFCVRRLRAPKMRSTAGLMNEFGAALQFFDGFGENWPALAECLSYLDEWLPGAGYILVIEHAEQLLTDERRELPALLRTIERAAKFWSEPIVDNGRFDRPARPFHVLMNLSDDKSTGSHIQGAAASIGLDLRRF